MHSDDHVLLVALRGGHDEGLGLLSVGVVDLEFGAVVEEGESAGAEVLGEDEAFGVGVAVFVKGGDFVDVGQDFGDDDDVVVAEVVLGEGVDLGYLNVGVQLLQFGGGGLGTGFVAHIFLGNIEC